jgi:hypothetical protein
MSTILHEQGLLTVWIRWLSWITNCGVRGAYNHAQYLDGRREMMIDADYIDNLLQFIDKKLVVLPPEGWGT